MTQDNKLRNCPYFENDLVIWTDVAAALFVSRKK
jgi:hypothetical protein